jgi:hypothetical protein
MDEEFDSSLEFDQPLDGDGEPSERGGEEVDGEEVEQAAKLDKAGRVFQKREAELQRRIKELEVSERHWAGVAQGKRGASADDEDEEEAPAARKRAKAEEPEEEELGGEELIKAIEEGGSKALKGLVQKYAKSLGLVSREEAEELADERANRRVKTEVADMKYGNALLREFPELEPLLSGDKATQKAAQKDPFVAATVEEFQKLVAEDRAMNSNAGLKVAARLARARVDADKRTASRGRRAPDDEDEERGARARRYSSLLGRASAGGDYADDEESEPVMTETARSLISGFGISDQEFLKAKKRTDREYRSERGGSR